MWQWVMTLVGGLVHVLADCGKYRADWRDELIWFIWLVSFNQKKPDRPDKPNNNLRMPAGFFSILLDSVGAREELDTQKR